MTDQSALRAWNLGDGVWILGNTRFGIPEGEDVNDYVLARLFDSVEGDGPWKATVSPSPGLAHHLILYPDGTVSAASTELFEERELSLLTKTPLREVGRFLGGHVTLGICLLGVSLATLLWLALPLLTDNGAHDDAAGAAESASALWTLPEGIVPVASSESFIVGTRGEDLTIVQGLDGTELYTAKGIATDSSVVRAASGPGMTIADAGNGGGVLIVDGKATPYEGKGDLLARGPVPVLVGGKAGDRKNFVVKDGALVEVQAPARGNSLFGGLPDGGTVWAVSGGKVTYVPATGDQRTITLVPPVAGATVSSWVATAESRTAVIWKTGDSSVLAVHATGTGATGTVEYKLALKDGEAALANEGRLLVGPGPISTTSPGAISTVISLDGEKISASAPACPSPLVTSEQLWCAGDKGQWMAGDFSVPSEPITAGKGFVLLTEGEGFVAVPGPNATTTK